MLHLYKKRSKMNIEGPCTVSNSVLNTPEAQVSISQSEYDNLISSLHDVQAQQKEYFKNNPAVVPSINPNPVYNPDPNVPFGNSQPLSQYDVNTNAPLHLSPSGNVQPVV